MDNTTRVGKVARKAWRNWEAVRHLSDRASTVLRIDGCVVRILIMPDKKPEQRRPRNEG